MPFVHVEYSERLAETFDRQTFAREVHAAAPGIVDAPAAAFKTRFRRIEESYFGEGEDDIDALFVQLSILTGRTQEAREKLAETVRDIALQHATAPEGRRLHVMVEVREMERESYRFHKD
ncbi:isomerase [Streptomyces sp. BPTC-684]|uniref:5-carboxymethyl-2-hydroxymuconate Delta-isomerase n=1 Tax=Streptomyces sp. BPTC-684 TaxID=3043734 RepID=UPI0024B1F9FC|nr:isomerase [Streptomyces sp. BPTC-684]WHM38982.1 isomerase [Streptomyces sp. BPTC-684]